MRTLVGASVARILPILVGLGMMVTVGWGVCFWVGCAVAIMVGDALSVVVVGRGVGVGVSICNETSAVH